MCIRDRAKPVLAPIAIKAITKTAVETRRLDIVTPDLLMNRHSAKKNLPEQQPASHLRKCDKSQTIGQFLTSQMIPTPTMAASKPALLSDDTGMRSSCSAILLMPFGNKAYRPPSRTRISAIAIINSSGTSGISIYRGAASLARAVPGKSLKKRKNSLSGERTIGCASPCSFS